MLVKGSGPRRAKIVAIGEAPGADEERVGRPFVGQAGDKLTALCESAGINRSEVYIDNVLPFRPPENKIEKVPKAERRVYEGRLRERLNRLQPNLIVPMGNTALSGVLGRRVYDSKAKQHLTITRARGFMFEYLDHPDRAIKVLPTVHPAFVLRAPEYEHAARTDWQRIALESRSPAVTFPERRHIIKPTLGEFEDFAHEALKAEYLSIDIETVRKPEPTIMCVGFSFDPKVSMTVPADDWRWGGKRWQKRAWPLIKKLCESNVEKVLQVGVYDAFWLLIEKGISINNWWVDLARIHQVLWTVEPHKLGYIASMLLHPIRYWKDEAKSPDEVAKYASDFDALQTYCGIDNCVQRELAPIVLKELNRRGRTEWFKENVGSLFMPLVRIMTNGVRTNEPTRQHTHARLIAQCIRLQQKLTEVAGEPLNGPKTLSAQKIATWLYDKERVAPLHDKKTKRRTTNEVALRRIMLRKRMVTPKAREGITLILDHRRKYQLSTFVADARIDPDGRMRTQYGFTETMRLTSSKSPRGSGGNTQNIDREIRSMFLPDPGCVFIQVDLSTAEDRIVKVLTGAKRLIEQARAAPWEFDAHADTARAVLERMSDEALTELERYVAGKKTNHATNYDMHGATMSDGLLKEGFVYTADECQDMIDRRHEHTPELADRFHRGIREVLMAEGVITNPFGWEATLDGRNMNSDAYREMYAFIPQSTVGMITNKWGVLPLDQQIQSGTYYAKINIQGHDSLLVSVRPDCAWDLARFVRRSLERPLSYSLNGGRPVELTIPCELELGSTWKCEYKWKQWPSLQEFNDALATTVERATKHGVFSARPNARPNKEDRNGVRNVRTVPMLSAKGTSVQARAQSV